MLFLWGIEHQTKSTSELGKKIFQINLNNDNKFDNKNVDLVYWLLCFECKSVRTDKAC